MLTPEQFAVLADMLTSHGEPLEAIERVRIALDPRSVVLSQEFVQGWQKARAPLFGGPSGALSFAAVPHADRAFADAVRAKVETDGLYVRLEQW